MIKRKIIAMLAALIALWTMSAMASGVSGSVRGNSLEVTWQVGSGECELTVYENDWPICVRRVNGGSGSTSIRIDNAAGSYKLRLKAPEGCYTATVSGNPATEKPTEVPVTQPAQAVTPKPTVAPTQAPTATPQPTKAATVASTATPTQKPTATPTQKPVSVSNRDDLAGQVLSLVNEERASRGLGAVRMDAELTRAACVRAGEIVQSFSHTRPDGTSWSTVSGSAYGENIARGQQTAEKVMAAWMTSTGHRENILRASYGSIGVCAYSYNGVMYWVQLFGK